MAKYLDTARQLQDLVEAFAVQKGLENADVAKIGEMINLAIRCCPRGVQHTVRKNIVDVAVGKFCHVSMHEVQGERGSFHAIEITPIGLSKADVARATLSRPVTSYLTDDEQRQRNNDDNPVGR